jgi:hypothetical protein
MQRDRQAGRQTYSVCVWVYMSTNTYVPKVVCILADSGGDSRTHVGQKPLLTSAPVP